MFDDLAVIDAKNIHDGATAILFIHFRLEMQEDKIAIRGAAHNACGGLGIVLEALREKFHERRFTVGYARIVLDIVFSKYFGVFFHFMLIEDTIVKFKNEFAIGFFFGNVPRLLGKDWCGNRCNTDQQGTANGKNGYFHGRGLFVRLGGSLYSRAFWRLEKALFSISPDSQKAGDRCVDQFLIDLFVGIDRAKQ